MDYAILTNNNLLILLDNDWISIYVNLHIIFVRKVLQLIIKLKFHSCLFPSTLMYSNVVL